MRINSTEISCGIDQVTGVSGYRGKAQWAEGLKDLAYQYLETKTEYGYFQKPDKVAYLVWSDTSRAFADYVEKTLGGVKVHGPRRNPNSGNRIYMVVWKVPQRKFAEWYQKNSR